VTAGGKGGEEMEIDVQRTLGVRNLDTRWWSWEFETWQLVIGGSTVLFVTATDKLCAEKE